MSLDLAILCARVPEAPDAYFQRVAGFREAWEGDEDAARGEWRGSTSSVRWHGAEAGALGEEEKAHAARVLGGVAGFVIRLSGRAGDEDGWDLVHEVAAAIAVDTAGVFFFVRHP